MEWQKFNSIFEFVFFTALYNKFKLAYSQQNYLAN